MATGTWPRPTRTETRSTSWASAEAPTRRGAWWGWCATAGWSTRRWPRSPPASPTGFTAPGRTGRTPRRPWPSARRFAREVTIRFLGVWDTGGRLGIRLDFAQWLNHDYYGFHDPRLSKIVENAYQAIALDEHRADYDICLWDPTEQPTQVLDSAGSSGRMPTSEEDTPTGICRTSPCSGCRTRPPRWVWDSSRVEVGPDNDRAEPTDSYAAFLNGLYARTHPPHLRPVFRATFGNEELDPSIDERRRPPPPLRPEEPGVCPPPFRLKRLESGTVPGCTDLARQAPGSSDSRLDRPPVALARSTLGRLGGHEGVPGGHEGRARSGP